VKVYVVFWDQSGNASLEIPLKPEGVRLMAELGKPLDVTTSDGVIKVPLAGRMYLECSGVSRGKSDCGVP